MLTGAALYAGPISTLVGRRELVRTIHVVAGLALPVPLVVGLVGRWGARLRRDLGRLNRWTRDDRRWLRRRARAASGSASSTRARSSTRRSSARRSS